MTRSVWKGPYTVPVLLEKQHKVFGISRSAEVTSQFIGVTFRVYNGKKYIELTVTENMVGHKFGEFSFTRASFIFKKKVKKK